MGARELARWFWALWPEAGKRGCSSLRQVEAALAVEVQREGWDEAVFRLGARAYAADRRTWGASSGRPMSAHNWVAAARWQGFEGSANGVRQTWEGPGEIRDQVLALQGDAFAVKYLDPATWDGAAIIAFTRYGAQQLRQLRLSVEVKDPVG